MKKLNETAVPAELQAAAKWWQCDVRSRDQVHGTVAEVAKEFDGLDVLLHAAGTWQPGAPDQISEDDLDFLLATNFKATVFTNQAAFEVMRNSGGRIINLGSSEGVFGNPIAATYSATKAAVQAWTRSAAKAWGYCGVTVNAVAPAVETRGAQRLREFLGPEGGTILDQQLQAVIPLGGRLGDPLRDLAPLLVFLAGEGSRFITGQLLAIDGGAMMVSG